MAQAKLNSLGSDLLSNILSLFNDARGHRDRSGMTNRLRIASCNLDQDDISSSEYDYECDCDEDNEDEECAICSGENEQLLSLDDIEKHIKSNEALDGVGELLRNKKIYEFIALANNTYSAVSDRPFKIDFDMDAVVIPEDKINEGTSAFYEYLQSFLDDNNVLVTEIDDAFQADSLKDVAERLSQSIDQSHEDEIRKSVIDIESNIRLKFRRSKIMREFKEIIRDIAYFPIGVSWTYRDQKIEYNNISSDHIGKVIDSESTAIRVDPRYAWFTSDWKSGSNGTGAFRLKSMTESQIKKMKGGQFDNEIDEVIDDDHNEYRSMASAVLFADDMGTNNINYDVLCFRGYVKSKDVENLGIELEEDTEKYTLVEASIIGGMIISLSIMDEELGIGVNHTTFRRRKGDSIYGLSLSELLTPFMTFYEGVIKGISKSVGKNVGSLIMIDTQVIKEPEKYINVGDDGVPTINFQDDMIMEWDSSELDNPQSTGVPVIVKKFDTDLGKLIPLLSLIDSQIESITGITSFLTQSNNLNSALRTESMLNTVRESNSVIIKSMLNQYEEDILRPIIEFFFFTSLSDNSDHLSDSFLSSSPRILLNSEITADHNTDEREARQSLDLSRFVQGASPEAFVGMINKVARDNYGYDQDVIPSDSKFNVRSSSVASGDV